MTDNHSTSDTPHPIPVTLVDPPPVPASPDRVRPVLLLTSPLAILGAYVLEGTSGAMGATLGALLALGNWVSLRWIRRRMETGTETTQRNMALLLVGKMMAMVALCGLIIAILHINAIGFALGLSTLVLATVVGGMMEAQQVQRDTRSPTGAGPTGENSSGRTPAADARAMSETTGSAST